MSSRNRKIISSNEVKPGDTQRLKRDKSSLKVKLAGIVRYVIMFVAICVFAVSAYQLITIFAEYKQSEDEYKDLSEIVFSIPAETEETTEDKTDSTEESRTEAETEPETEAFVFDFQSLYAINNDSVGWIRIDGTNINYPVVAGDDNDYYLSHTINRTQNSSGTIFLDSRSEEGLAAKNVIVYGHNMKNGSMFGDLKKYRNVEFYNEHDTFEFYTENGILTYRIVSVILSDSIDQTVYSYAFESDEKFLEYINYIKSLQLYDTGVTVDATDSVMSLSTCTADDGQRLVVVAKKIP